MKFLIDLIKNNKILSFFLFVAILLTIILFFTENHNKIEVTTTSISPGSTISTINPNTEIIFYFSGKIDKKNLVVKITPEEDYSFNIVDSPEPSLLIKPKGWWKYDALYQVTISHPLLQKPFAFNFSFKFPPQEELPPQVGEEGGIDYHNLAK